MESRPSILGKVSDPLGGHDIDILGSHTQVSDDATLLENVKAVFRADRLGLLESPWRAAAGRWTPPSARPPC